MAFGITEPVIEEIKIRTDLADLIAGYGIQVKRAGGSFKACCPFHHEKTPSFHIQPERGYYHCFGCGESGDAIKFVMKYEGLTFVEAAKKLAEKAGVAIEEKADPQSGARKRLYAMHAELAAFYRRCLKDAKEAAPARDYLSSRDISEETAEAFQIGYAPLSAQAMLKWAEKHCFTAEELELAGVLKPPRYQGGRWYSPFAGRLMFSICDRSGRVIAFSGRTLETDKAKMRGGKYVNSPETPIFKKSNVLYAFDKAASNIVKAPRREAIVCEGQIDVIRCHASGFPTAVASQGTAFTSEHVSILKKSADSAVLVFDGDNAGRKAAIRTGGEFIAASIPVRVATLPPGEDPDSLLRAKGADAFRTCLDDAESIIAFQVRAEREQEANPDSYDGLTRISRSVLSTIGLCSEAVMRAALLQEASELLRLPVSALEEDLSRVKESGKMPSRSVPKPALRRDVSIEAPIEVPANDLNERSSSGLPSEDAAALENNPPPTVEMALMEFLFGNGCDGELAQLLDVCAPDALFAHPVTAAFVRAYSAEARGEDGAMLELRSRLPERESRNLAAVFLARERAALSELEPRHILEDFLRRLWSAAVRRKLGAMSVSTGAEHDRRRLELSALTRKFQRGAWPVIEKMMTASAMDEW
jgi:DNA primase